MISVVIMENLMSTFDSHQCGICVALSCDAVQNCIFENKTIIKDKTHVFIKLRALNKVVVGINPK